MARKGQAEELRCNGRLMGGVNEGARNRVHRDDCQIDAWVVLPLDGAPSPPLAPPPHAPSRGPPLSPATPAWTEEESSVASGSRLSTAATIGAIALGLGCVLCAASACAYARARSKRAAPAAAEIANPRLFDGGSEGGLTLTLEP